MERLLLLLKKDGFAIWKNMANRFALVLWAALRVFLAEQK